MSRETYARLRESVVKRLTSFGYNKTVANQFWRFYQDHSGAVGNFSENGFEGFWTTLDKRELEILKALPKNISKRHRRYELSMSLKEVIGLLGIDLVTRIMDYQEKTREVSHKAFSSMVSRSEVYELDDETGEYRLVSSPELRLVR